MDKAFRSFVELLSRLLWLATLAGALMGGLNFFAVLGANESPSAPQLAALAAQSLVYAIIPYVFARAWDEALRRAPAAATAPAVGETRAA